MKILTVVWNLFDEKSKELEISRNGGSIMIYNICEYIGRKVESYVFVGNMSIEGVDFGHIHVVDNRKNLPQEKKDISIWQNALKKRFEEILKEINPDFVLIQGSGEFSYNSFFVCKNNKTPYAFVEHLYMGKERTGEEVQDWPEWEERAFGIDDIHIIAIGNAMKKEILRDYPELIGRVCAITNGVSHCGDVMSNNLADVYNVQGKKILVCVGGISERKNQRQIVRAFYELPNEYKNDIVVLFCGADSVKTPRISLLLSEIRKYNLEGSLKYIGSFPPEMMSKVYSLADGLIMASLYEGLSLVALEMITYGKPVIMFSDNETAGDVNDPKAVVFANDHSDHALADAIVEWYERDWDEEYIKEYSKYYNMERVADDYIEYCKQRIKESK